MGLMDNPPPFQFGPAVPTNWFIESSDTSAEDRVNALKHALALIGDRTTEEILQAAHWIAEGDIIRPEGEEEDEDDE